MKILAWAALPLLFPIGIAQGQTLECRTISKGPNSTIQYGQPTDIPITLADGNFPADYKVTGGGCDLSDAQGFGFITESAPLGDGTGYVCRVTPRYPQEVVRTRAFLTACHIRQATHGDGTGKAPFNNVGLGGDAVAIARTNAGTIPYSLRVCNLSGGAPIDVELSPIQKKRLEVSRCLEVDTPQRVFFRVANTASVDEHGVYKLFNAGTFSKQPNIDRATAVPDAQRVEIGPFRSTTATCRRPNPGEPFDGKSYWGLCEFNELRSNKNYRVCFDAGYSNQKDSLEYAGGLLRIVLDRKLMTIPPVNGQLDPYKYLSIAPGGCRDLFGVNDASVRITNNAWNDQSVSMITYRFAEIASPK